MVLPVMEEDRSVRILRAPDALYFAQHEICSYYAEQEDFERALPEVRRLYDLARSSMQSHFALINVLARLERFDEIIEVARHGLRIASDRSAIGYLFYRLAFAIGTATSSSSRWRATASCRAARSRVAARWRKCRAL